MAGPLATTIKIALGADAYSALARALLGSGKVRLTIEGAGENVSAEFAVRYVDGGGKSRRRLAVLAQIDEFQLEGVAT